MPRAVLAASRRRRRRDAGGSRILQRRASRAVVRPLVPRQTWRMEARGTDRPAAGSVPGGVVASVWLAVALGPLNSSMIAVALVSLQRDFGVSSAAVTPLISAF